MSDFSQAMISQSGYTREGFAGHYDQYRPSPPAALQRILTLVAGVDRPRLVVDLGSGTGLSARAWAGSADRVVGVEPNPRMIEQARRATAEPNVTYQESFADRTGLASGSADLVTCSQSFHWMEPAPVLAEAARVLRPGGVFAAYDYDLPPVVEPEVDEAFAAYFASRGRARARLGMESGAVRWPKNQHADRIRDSGQFRFTREIVCHAFGETDAGRVIGLAESLSGPAELSEGRAPEVAAALERLRECAGRLLGGPRPMVVCYRIRAGIKG